MNSLQDLQKEFNAAADKVAFLNEIRQFIHDVSPHGKNPVDRVLWVPISKVQANDYNPNQVAKTEMGLLYTSIHHDGYTQPIVTVYDEKKDKYIVVDGFHRYSVMRFHNDIKERNGGFLPVVVIEKDINDRMASTIRHNRARGKHSVAGMSTIVFEMLMNGWTDAEVLQELGMEAEELIRLKHITGFSKLFKDVKYSQSWETGNQIKIRKEYEKGQEGSE